MKNNQAVIPAKAGIQPFNLIFKILFNDWIPAFAGMTVVVFLFVGCEKNPIDRLINPVPSGAVSSTSGIYILYDDEIKTGGGLGFIPGGENQAINLSDGTEPRRTINQIRYSWNGQDVTDDGLLQHAFAGFSFTITPDFSTFDSAQPKDLNANNAGYDSLSFYIRGSLSSDTFVRIEGPDNDNGGTAQMDSTPVSSSSGYAARDFTLTDDWQQITITGIPTTDFDAVKTYFTVTIQFIQPVGTTAAGSGGTIYLDDIRFQ